MKALIIDNEVGIINGLQELIKLYCEDIKEVRGARNLQECEHILTSWSPDILFLDVELDEMTGMDLLDKLEHVGFEVIFITAYDQYAIDAIKYDAVDYLLKPIDPDDLVSAVSKAGEALAVKKDHLRLKTIMSSINEVETPVDHLIVSDKENIYKVLIDDILYLEAHGPYTKIVKANDSLFVSKNLKQFQETLNAAGFFRTHHSYLANLSKMTKYEKINSVLELCGEYKVPVSVRKRDGLFEQIKIKN